MIGYVKSMSMIVFILNSVLVPRKIELSPTKCRQGLVALEQLVVRST